jgi:hypothetical protein
MSIVVKSSLKNYSKAVKYTDIQNRCEYIERLYICSRNVKQMWDILMKGFFN